MDSLPGTAKTLYPAAQLSDEFKQAMEAYKSGVVSRASTVKPPQFKRLRARHRLVIMLSEAGFTNNEIALATGYTAGRVSTILNAPHPGIALVRQEMGDRVAGQIEDLSLRIRYHAPEALETMVKHMRSTDAAQSRLAARDILDRAGYSPVKKQMTLGATVPVEQLAQLAATVQTANEVQSRRSEWEVQNPPKQEKAG